MVPLKLLKDGYILELSTDVFYQSIIDVCKKHREDHRALAFAFILYDFENPQILKILNDNFNLSMFMNLNYKFRQIFWYYAGISFILKHYSINHIFKTAGNIKNTKEKCCYA